MPVMQQQEYKWEVGDKALFEHKEVTIHEVRDGQVHGVNDGGFLTFGSRMNERLFPVTDRGVTIANFFHGQYEELHSAPGNRLLNWPRLAGEIDERFNTTMRLTLAGDLMGANEELAKATGFFVQVRRHIQDVLNIQVGEVRLFNRN